MPILGECERLVNRGRLKLTAGWNGELLAPQLEKGFKLRADARIPEAARIVYIGPRPAEKQQLSFGYGDSQSIRGIAN